LPAQEVGGGLTAVFANAALRYWLLVFPRTAHELRRLRRRARSIQAPTTRRLALEALAKRGNLEGAAAFATFVPWRQRGRVVRALVAFQAAYNYVDLLAEQPSADPVARARQLHEALCVALDTTLASDACAAIELDDDGLLDAILQRCRAALSALPAYGVAAPAARAAAQRIVVFQSLSLGADDALERWAVAQLAAESTLAWWELAAAAGSSLAVHALIAAGASVSLDDARVAELEGVYFPWAGALHSLLDSLVDEVEDAATAQLSLIGCYPSPLLAARQMRQLTIEALTRARRLPDGRRQALLVMAMACSYIAALRPAGGAQTIAREVRGALGSGASAALLVFELRHRAGMRGEDPQRSPPVRRACVGEQERGVDAGAA
jgi:tetraprenyl-beta-curcumene synthase